MRITSYRLITYVIRQYNVILVVVVLFHSWRFLKEKRPDLLTLMYCGTQGTVPFKTSVTFTVSVSLLCFLIRWAIFQNIAGTLLMTSSASVQVGGPCCPCQSRNSTCSRCICVRSGRKCMSCCALSRGTYNNVPLCMGGSKGKAGIQI